MIAATAATLVPPLPPRSCRHCRHRHHVHPAHHIHPAHHVHHHHQSTTTTTTSPPPPPRPPPLPPPLVFWNYHQPEGPNATDWVGDGSGDLVALVQACAARGLFVNLRLGPYVCAEWDYGGIPVWVAQQPGVVMRRYNDVWMDLMAAWVTEVVEKMRAASLWAPQGGPIILAQVSGWRQGWGLRGEGLGVRGEGRG